MLRSVSTSCFPEHQASLLRQTVERYFGDVSGGDWTRPLGLFHAVYRMFAVRTDEKALYVAEFCSFFLLALDLFDDVQDDDLEGKHYAPEGPAVAINSALALLFLSHDALRRAAELEEDPSRRLECLGAMIRISLLAVSAQHRDLTSALLHPSRGEVLEMHAGKTSTVQLIAECAAIAAGAPLPASEEVGRFGGRLAVLTQIVDDVRDVFGKTDSPDLRSNKATYLRACFDELATAEQRAELATLRQRLDEPGSLEAIRALLADAGALDLCAQTAHEIRVEVYEILAALPAPTAHKRILLSIVDSLAELLYPIEPLPEGEPIFRQTGELAARIEEQAALFRARLGEDVVSALRFEPWHRPVFMYEPGAGVVRYPDLEGVPEETLSEYAAVLGGDADLARAYVSDSLSLLVAHELFHALRDQSSRLGMDAWHEEYVANMLAVAYLRAFDPAGLERAMKACGAFAELPLAPASARRVSDVLRRAPQPSADHADYDAELVEMAQIHAKMCLSPLPDELSVLMERWLAPEAAAAMQ